MTNAFIVFIKVQICDDRERFVGQTYKTFVKLTLKVNKVKSSEYITTKIINYDRFHIYFFKI